MLISLLAGRSQYAWIEQRIMKGTKRGFEIEEERKSKARPTKLLEMVVRKVEIRLYLRW